MVMRRICSERGVCTTINYFVISSLFNEGAAFARARQPGVPAALRVLFVDRSPFFRAAAGRDSKSEAVSALLA